MFFPTMLVAIGIQLERLIMFMTTKWPENPFDLGAKIVYWHSMPTTVSRVRHLYHPTAACVSKIFFLLILYRVLSEMAMECLSKGDLTYCLVEMHLIRNICCQIYPPFQATASDSNLVYYNPSLLEPIAQALPSHVRNHPLAFAHNTITLRKRQTTDGFTITCIALYIAFVSTIASLLWICILNHNWKLRPSSQQKKPLQLLFPSYSWEK